MSSLGRQVKSTSTCAAAAPALEATVTPASLLAAARAAALTSCTTSFTPALARFDAMGMPMVPRPMNPTVSFISCSLSCQEDLGSGRSGGSPAERLRDHVFVHAPEAPLGRAPHMEVGLLHVEPCTVKLHLSPLEPLGHQRVAHDVLELLEDIGLRQTVLRGEPRIAAGS